MQRPMYIVGFSLMAAVLATVIAARLAFEATVNTGSEPVNQPWAQHTMQFVTWNQEKWSAWIRDAQQALLHANQRLDELNQPSRKRLPNRSMNCSGSIACAASSHRSW